MVCFKSVLKSQRETKIKIFTTIPISSTNKKCNRTNNWVRLDDVVPLS